MSVKRERQVKEYYGKILQSSEDLKTSACCPIDGIPNHIKPYLENIHPEILNRFYGCGSPIPFALKGKTVLDLGCGTGRDAYILSQAVGEQGKVIAIDMTEEQLEIAQEYLPYHMEKFGYASPNIEFHQSYIEDLAAVAIADNSIDVVVSNCVINLSADKEAVFAEIFRVLKPGGELYFADIFADRRMPAELAEDPVFIGECLGGALYIEDFRRLLSNLNCPDYRIVSSEILNIENKEIQQKAGDIVFYSMTLRAFKCELEDLCEDYGHVATYLGTIEECKEAFLLDDHHLFTKDKKVKICGNTANMLSHSHYAPHFKVEGDFSTHYGVFDCSDQVQIKSQGGCC